MKSLASPPPDIQVCGRYAPSPTGRLHLGNARTALAAWLSVRARGGRFVYRLEDIDGPRVVPGADAEIQRDLRWLGIDWDDGPGPDGVDAGPHEPYRQSQRRPVYDAALHRLAASGRLFACRRSRRDLAGLASAPHGAGLPPYPRAWRPSERLAPADLTPALDAAIRFVVDYGVTCVDDRVQGRICQDVAADVGDVVLRRRDGVDAYQLAVVVDDLAMGVTEVVRGLDLLDSTARQVQLVRALGGRVPDYAHLGLVVNAEGAKLSKRDAGLSLAELRDTGVHANAVVGWLAWSLGLRETIAPVPPSTLVASFDWARIPPGPVAVPDGLPSVLTGL